MKLVQGVLRAEGKGEAEGCVGWQGMLWYSGEMAELLSAEKCSCSRGAEIAGGSVGGTSYILLTMHTSTHYTTQCCN